MEITIGGAGAIGGTMGAAILPHLAADGVIVSMQNGFNEERIYPEVERVG
jgi:ketopantoate reductase